MKDRHAVNTQERIYHLRKPRSPVIALDLTNVCFRVTVQLEKSPCLLSQGKRLDNLLFSIAKSIKVIWPVCLPPPPPIAPALHKSFFPIVWH